MAACWNRKRVELIIDAHQLFIPFTSQRFANYLPTDDFAMPVFDFVCWATSNLKM